LVPKERASINNTICILSQSSQLIKDIVLNSEKLLKIVTFRFDSKEFADMLTKKAREGVSIEVVTTPPDNVAKDELRPIVETMYQELERNGVKLHLCSWEAGEHRLTTTSMSGKQSAGIGEKWYSLHLQLFINEKQCLVTSRPLTSENTLDIFYRSSDAEIMNNALKKLAELNNYLSNQEKLKN
jgi:hypothetical protein